MHKISTYTKKRNAFTASLVKKTSELTGVNVRSVYRIINGDQTNEMVLKVYMQLVEGENLLMQEVKKLIPFSNN
jgi:hypothetical protein